VIPRESKLPFYLKAIIFLVGFFALLTILYIAQGIIVPLVFAMIFAIVLHPVVNFLVRIKVNRVIAIVLILLLTFLVITAIGVLLFSQARRFAESWPILIEKITKVLDQAITWVSGNSRINAQNIYDWISKAERELLDKSTAGVGQALFAVGDRVVTFLLIPVYVFLILFYHPLLLEFIHKLFSKNDQRQVGEIINQIKTVIQRYLVGLIIEAALVATLNSVALLIFGIDYAILLGIIGALLNIIPFIGGIVAVALPMMVALATKSSPLYALYVMAVYLFIQLIDNNYIVPKIVASKVKINALFSIIVVIAGNALWGIPGMFLSIPLLAVIKLIFDNIESLKPWGFLLGDTMPRLLKIKPLLRKLRKNHP
jgi:predicted PurR-regulated permease PerM